MEQATEQQNLSDLRKAELVERAEALGLETKGTKADLIERITEAEQAVEQARESKRGSSEIENPVAYVHQKAQAMYDAAMEAGEDRPRRKDVVNACIADGVAFYTARTQYQVWFKATNAGANPEGLSK